MNVVFCECFYTNLTLCGFSFLAEEEQDEDDEEVVEERESEFDFQDFIKRYVFYLLVCQPSLSNCRHRSLRFLWFLCVSSINVVLFHGNMYFAFFSV